MIDPLSVAGQALAALGKLVASLPVEGVSALVRLVRALTTSPDPSRAMQRAAAAAASEVASENVLKRLLGRARGR